MFERAFSEGCGIIGVFVLGLIIGHSWGTKGDQFYIEQIDSLERENAELKMVISARAIELDSIDTQYEKERDSIISQFFDSDYEFFTKYLKD